MPSHDQVHGLTLELDHNWKSRKTATSELRVALQKATQLSFMEKEKNKLPSYAMRISMQINKVIWTMIEDGKHFAEVEINDLVSNLYFIHKHITSLNSTIYFLRSFISYQAKILH